MSETNLRSAIVEVLRRHQDVRNITSIADELEAALAPSPVIIKTEGPWQWWAGDNEEWMKVGPCATRDEAIAEATGQCMGEFQDEEGAWKLNFYIVEARSDPLRLADWIETDQLLERADENIGDSDRVAIEYDEGPWFRCTIGQERDLEARIKQACDQWQSAHGLTFKTSTFSHMRNGEAVVVPHPDNAAGANLAAAEPVADQGQDEVERCPICAVPFKPNDLCATDITEGTCHAACLEGAAVVDLDTGEGIEGGTIRTYSYSDVMEPPAPQQPAAERAKA